MNDQVCRDSIKKISQRNISDEITDSKYFEEFKNLIGNIDQNKVSKIFKNSCFSLINGHIRKSLKNERRIEVSTMEKIIENSELCTLDSNLFHYSQDLLNLKKFYKKYLQDTNNLFYLNEVTTSLQDTLKRDPYLYGASPSNIWFNHKIREKIQQEYKVTQQSLNTNCFGLPSNQVSDRNSYLPECVTPGPNVRHQVIRPGDLAGTVQADGIEERIGGGVEEAKVKRNTVDLNLIYDGDENDLFSNVDQDVNKTPIHQYSNEQDAGKLKKQAMMEITDCYLKGCFDKISEYQDLLGRRVMLDIDYSGFHEYLNIPKMSEKLSRKLEALYPYLKQSYMEKLAQLAFSMEGRSEHEKVEISQEIEELTVTEIEKSQILKNILDDQLSYDESLSDILIGWGDSIGISLEPRNAHEKNLYKESRRIPKPSFTRLAEANKIQEILREDLLEQVYSKSNHFECELVEKEGAYWGDIFILEQFPNPDLINNNHSVIRNSKQYYLYYKSRNLLLEEHKDMADKRYLFRSFDQKEGEIEILINLKNAEIMRKNYLLNPVAVEIYDKESCKMYFINFMHYKMDIVNKATTLRFIDYIENYVRETKIIQSPKHEFEKMKYKESFKEGKIDKLDYLLLVNKYSDRSFNASMSQYPVVPWLNIEDPRDHKFTFKENDYIRKLDK